MNDPDIQRPLIDPIAEAAYTDQRSADIGQANVIGAVEKVRKPEQIKPPD